MEIVAVAIIARTRSSMIADGVYVPLCEIADSKGEGYNKMRAKRERGHHCYERREAPLVAER